MARLEYELREIDQLYESAVDTFGLELRIQTLVTDTHGIENPRKVYYRVAQEPPLASLWQNFCEVAFDRESALMAVRMLSSSNTQYRTGSMYAQSEDRGLFYFRPPLKAICFPKLQTVANQSDDWLQRAARTFSEFILYHPFSDGNGRFGRGLIYGALGAAGLLRSPCLGLGPIAHFHQKQLNSLIRVSATSGCLSELERALATILSDCAESVRVGLQRPPGRAAHLQLKPAMERALAPDIKEGRASLRPPTFWDTLS